MTVLDQTSDCLFILFQDIRHVYGGHLNFMDADNRSTPERANLYVHSVFTSLFGSAHCGRFHIGHFVAQMQRAGKVVEGP